MRDPDSDWVNVGTYRNQIFDRDSMGIFIAPGKHGRLIREKYFERGERCPIVVVVGADPLLFMAACAEGIAYGQGELDWAGGVRGAPIEVVKGPLTGSAHPGQRRDRDRGLDRPGTSATTKARTASGSATTRSPTARRRSSTSRPSTTATIRS